jgi:hypothetical protein
MNIVFAITDIWNSSEAAIQLSMINEAEIQDEDRVITLPPFNGARHYINVSTS